MKLIFILGPHRTGTKSYAHYFQKYFDREVHSFHQYGSLRLVNVFSNLFLSKLITEATYKWVLKKTLVKHIEAHSDKPIYLVSNGFNFLAVKYILEIYNDVKVVHAIRDPRTFVISYINFIDGRWQSKLANRMIPYWHLSGYRQGSFSNQTWKSFNRIEKYVWYWCYKNDFIESNYGNQKENYLRLRLEDIENGSLRVGQLAALHDFVGLPFQKDYAVFFDKKVNESRGELLPKWQKWNKNQAKKVYQICAPLMKRYGYGFEPAWVELIESPVNAQK